MLGLSRLKMPCVLQTPHYLGTVPTSAVPQFSPYAVSSMPATMAVSGGTEGTMVTQQLPGVISTSIAATKTSARPDRLEVGPTPAPRVCMHWGKSRTLAQSSLSFSPSPHSASFTLEFLVYMSYLCMMRVCIVGVCDRERWSSECSLYVLSVSKWLWVWQREECCFVVLVSCQVCQLSGCLYMCCLCCCLANCDIQHMHTGCTQCFAVSLTRHCSQTHANLLTRPSWTGRLLLTL